VNAIELFEEISNSPASFTASRVVLASAALKKQRVSFRDAMQAYLQASICGPGRVTTWVELPRDWWPNSWFVDGKARQVPKYRRPVCLLLLALYGHPESGRLWEILAEAVLIDNQWAKVWEWPGVYYHEDGSSLVVYVDDLMLAATIENSRKHWAAIELKIEFKDLMRLFAGAIV
jgi:hypothetical protein